MVSWVKDLLWLLTSERAFNREYDFNCLHTHQDPNGKPFKSQGNIRILKSWYFGKKDLQKDMGFFRNIKDNLCEKVGVDLKFGTVMYYDFSIYVGPYRVSIQCSDYASNIHNSIRCLFDYAENILLSKDRLE